LAEAYIDVFLSRTNSFYTNPASGFPFPEATEEAAGIAKQAKV
jgi:hypothetical protein